MRRANDEVIRLKRALKAAAKEGDALQAGRKKAIAAAVKARVKAKTAETKYDEVVLAEIVRREKARDRTAAAGKADAGAAGTTSATPQPKQPAAATKTDTRPAAAETAPAAAAGTPNDNVAGNGTPDAS